MPNLLREEKHFSLFQKIFGFEKQGYIWRSESPDFVVTKEGRVIGIEHTEIFIEKNYPLQALESIEDDICMFATKYADESGYVPTITKILFGDIKGLKQTERFNLAKKITDYVQLCVSNTNNDAFTQLKLDPKLKTIKDIFVTIAPRGFNNHYKSVRTGWGKVDPSSEIYSAVKKKAQKLNLYSSRCEEIWLLIVADGYKPSSFLGRDSKVPLIPSLHGFDRVFFMFYLSKQVQEILSYSSESQN